MKTSSIQAVQFAVGGAIRSACRVLPIIFLLALSVLVSGQSGAEKASRHLRQVRRPASLQPNAPWPRFHANNQSSGRGIGGGSNGLLRWTFNPGGGRSGSAAIGADGTIYISGDDSSYVAHFYAINPDGSVKWIYSFASQYPVQATSCPTLGSDGTIYFGASDGNLYALSPSGGLLWTFQTGGQINSSPAISSDGVIYFGSLDNNLYAVNLDGSLNWIFPVTGRIYTSPALASDGTIYISDYSDNLYAIKPNGSLKWVVNKFGNTFWDPAVGSDGTIYAPCLDGNLYAIDPTGNVKWTFKIGSQSENCPSIGPDGTIYIGTINNVMYAVSPTGVLQWTYSTSESIWDSAVASDGSIYFGCSDNYIYCLNKDGTLRWKHQTLGLVENAPALGADGTVFIASSDKNLYALGTPFLTGLTLNPKSVPGGNPSIGTVTLAVPAASGGVTINLASDNSDALVPATVVVPAGASTVNFTVTTIPVVQNATATITATASGSIQTALLSITSPIPASVDLSPSNVTGGTSSTGTVTLNGPAPTGGTTVTLSSDTNGVTLPASELIPAGQTTATFTISTVPVNATENATITASVGVPSATAVLTVVPPALASVSVSPSAVVGGTNATGTVTLTGPAPTGGEVVNLTSTNSVVSVPSSVTIAAGTASSTFVVTTSPVFNPTSSTIRASMGGNLVSTTLTVNPSGVAGLSLSPTSVTGTSPSTGTVTLNGPAPASGLTVSLSSSSGSAIPPFNVVVPAQATTATFTISTLAVSSSVSAVITASASTSSAKATLTITPPTPTSLSLSPSTVLGGASSTGTVTLSGPAPSGGMTVTLSSNQNCATPPSTVTVPTGTISASFTVATTSVSSTTSATITASAGGKSATATLTVKSAVIVSLTLAPNTVVGGAPTTGTVTLSGAAPAGGVTVILSSNSASAVPPSSIIVPALQSSITFNINSLPVGAVTTAKITGTTGSTSQSATLTVTPPDLVGLSLSPTTVVGGNASIGTVTLSGPAPSGGVAVTLGSNNPQAHTPANVTVAAGSSTGTFTVTTNSVTSPITATISATLGSTTKTATLSIAQLALIGLGLNPPGVTGGLNSTGTVTLNGPATSGGVVVSLSSNSTSVASVPKSVTVPSGQASATFTIATTSVTALKTVTIGASYNGTNLTASLTVNSPTVASIAVNPSDLSGGTPATGTVTLSGPAPKGGIVVKLASNKTQATVPASVSIAAGKSSATFTVKTVAVASLTVATLSATLGALTDTTTLTIKPPVLLQVTLNPASVVGLTSSTGTATISGPSPAGGLKVGLSSNQSAATVPSTVTIPAGASHATFTVKTLSVASHTAATISATLNGTTLSATLAIEPPVISSLTLSPTKVAGGKTSTGTVKLGTAAPSSGVTISLKSGSGFASVPATVTVAGGKTSATFTVQTTKVGSQAVATISATLGGTSKSANLTITP
ncbi:MAG: PQQ-binding-like beta-propeller repeat protein [Fimbriimonas sp.]|nr:PQQ-binding-like beta-propeller repeat protein [Fimbriimonas sp.]